MTNWARLHLTALQDALRHVTRAPGSFLLNVLAVAIALALPFGGQTILENVRPVSEQLAVEPEVSVFMANDTPRERAVAVATQIQSIVKTSGNVAKIEFVPKEKALTLIKHRTGLSDALAALGDNPLPDAYVLKLLGIQNAADAVRVEDLASKLKSLPDVDDVQIDSDWVKRLTALMHVLRLALLLLGITLGAVVIAVVFNTIRLQVLTQREEIEQCRLFGATNAFICRPFYYSGALLGLMAGGLALAAVLATLPPLNRAIAEFARLYASEFRLTLPSTLTMLTLLGISSGLGLLGAHFCVKHHLKRLN